MRFYFNGIEATTNSLAIYDKVCGYKAIPGEKRYLLISNGIAEIDHSVNVNSSGWYSKNEYNYKKENSQVKRFMVLGDSFSSGIVVPVTWPDKVSELLNDSINDFIELYNFSVDGSGLQNWYQIYFHELVPHYEFDGIIIAPSAEAEGIPDFDRKLIIAESKNNTTFINFLDITSQVPEDTFIFDSAMPMASIYSENELEEIKVKYSSFHNKKFRFNYHNPDLHFLAILCGVTDGINKIISYSNKITAYNKKFNSYSKLSDLPYKMDFFDERYKFGFMLKEIINDCKKNNKVVILAGIPDYRHSLEFIDAKQSIYRNELKFLSDKYQITYFDGYTIFNGKDSCFVHECFYKNDAHWNKNGANLFAQEFSKNIFF